MKILYLTTVGQTMGFFTDLVEMLVREGNSVDIATNDAEGKSSIPKTYYKLGCKIHKMEWTRNPLSLQNLKAINKLKKLLESEKYDLIHCHTPIAAMCTRIAARKYRKKGLKVVYTAHGFHFYQGAPMKNWLVYYPIEWLCSFLTDELITINEEDYNLAEKTMHARHVDYVKGVGINISKIREYNKDKEIMRKELEIPQDSFLMASVGELNNNKNHSVILDAMSIVNDDNIHYMIAGEGENKSLLEKKSIELGIKDRVHLLGYRNDINDLYHCADVCVFPSIREGLPIAPLEAMAVGLPLICSDNRGLRNIIKSSHNGMVCKYYDSNEFAKAIKYLADDKTNRKKMGEINAEMVKEFDVSLINKTMKDIYEKTINNK